MSRKEPSWRRYLTFWRPTVDRDVDAEIRFHLDQRTADLMTKGRTEAQARVEAEQEFGDRETYRNRIRAIDHRVQARRNRAEWFDAIRGDVRLAWRGMKRAPMVSTVVVVTLALGIGANGAVFSMLDRIFFRPPPGVAAPTELRRLYGNYKAPPPQADFVRATYNYPEIVDMQEALGKTVELIGFMGQRLPMGTDDNPPELHVTDVAGDYFRALGVRPWRGRFFAPEELDVRTPHMVAVISHRFWSRQLGSDSAIVGKTIPLGRNAFTVIGIAPPGFDGIDVDAIDVWRPAGARQSRSGNPWYQQRNGSSITVFTRLKPGANEVEVLHAANNGLHKALESTLATRTTLSLGSIIYARGPVNREKEPFIAVRLAGVTVIVLLIAIANVANLLLTRAMERRREIAIRVALGVSRKRLAGLLITESAVLALVAGTAAMFVATWGAAVIRHLLLPDVRWANGPLDWRLSLFTFTVALLAGVLSGFLPFIRAGSLDLTRAMRGGAREGGAHRSRMRAGLIVAQAALSVVLLTGAALFLRSLNAVHGLDLGLDAEGVMSATVSSGRRVIPASERAAALVPIRERVSQLPGVRAAALASMPPMFGFTSDRIYLPGRDSTPQNENGPPTFISVSPDYFRAAGIAVAAGRGFTTDDRDGAPPVMVVTETTARFIWKKAAPIGECVRISMPDAPCTTVIGVVKDVRRDKVIETAMLQFFLPLTQGPAWSRDPYALIIGTTPDRVGALRQEVNSIIQSQLPGSHSDIKTVAERLEPQYRPYRIGASLFTAFGLLALVVASIGMYSAIAYAVTQRSHELGVRMALGAQRREIGGLIVGSGLRVVAAGVLVGAVLALILSRLIESLLYGTQARDPILLAGVATILLAVAALAAAMPAWRASRLDPVRALRAE